MHLERSRLMHRENLVAHYYVKNCAESRSEGGLDAATAA